MSNEVGPSANMLGPRVEVYWVELLSADDAVIRVLGTVEGGKVDQNWDRAIRGTLQFTVADEPDINWAQCRFRPWVMVNGTRWPLGVFIPSSPKTLYTAEGKTRDVQALDKTVALEDHGIERTYSVPAGANIVDVVRQCIEIAGETRMSITPSNKVVREMMVWAPGTTMLRVVNDLLESANYNRLWSDGLGQLRAEPHLDPKKRPVTAAFIEGEEAIHSPVFTRMQDVASVPNRVVLTATGSAELPGMISVYENTNPNSPYSFPSRGRWVVRSYPVEAADQDTLDALAQRYMNAAMTPLSYLDVAHAVVPLELGDVVQLASSDVSAYAWVNEYAIELEDGALMTGKWQEVEYE